jgi:hypothetical protein
MFGRILMFFSALIHGRNATEIDFDVDLLNADGYYAGYRREKILGVERTVRVEFAFTVDNKRLLRYKPNVVAMLIMRNAILSGYTIQYVTFFLEPLTKLTPEQLASGHSANDLAQVVYTQLGQIDTITFLNERKKAEEKAGLYIDQVLPDAFDFHSPNARKSRFSTQNATAAIRPHPPLKSITGGRMASSSKQPREVFSMPPRHISA